MRLLHTPGHSPGHLAAYLPGPKLLVTADSMTAPEGLAGPNEVFTPDMETAAESVGLLADLDVEHVLCFHGGPVEATDDDIADVYASLQS